MFYKTLLYKIQLKRKKIKYKLIFLKLYKLLIKIKSNKHTSYANTKRF